MELQGLRSGCPHRKRKAIGLQTDHVSEQCETEIPQASTDKKQEW
jgi:hypothetical protein